MSEDPIGFNGGNLNLYGYVNNLPLISTDPSGLYPGAPWWTWGTVTDITNIKPTPKKIMSRVRSLTVIRERLTQIEIEAAPLYRSKCPEDQEKYRKLMLEYDRLLDQSIEEMDIFNDMKEPDPRNML